jgi:hypothetical protein
MPYAYAARPCISGLHNRKAPAARSSPFRART